MATELGASAMQYARYDLSIGVNSRIVDKLNRFSITVEAEHR
jgi:hypothetical protein